MGSSETRQLSPRLQWTLDWQTRNMVPLMKEPDFEHRLLRFWTETRRLDEVMNIVVPTPAARIVDIGGGLTTSLRWMPGSRICVDPLAHAYNARAALPVRDITFIAGNGEALPMNDESVDLAICTNCIDHVDDPDRVISEIRRILRPGGWLWITCEEYPAGSPRNEGHPHALDERAIRALVEPFSEILGWSEPWRGVYRFLRGLDAHGSREFGFLLRNDP